MAAEVSSLRRILNGGDVAADQSGKQTAMITRDFLGGRSNLLDFKELDLDMHVPSGWEKRLDLKSGKVYVQKKESMISASSKSSENKVNAAGAATKLQDLNFPPTATPKPPYNIPSSDNTASLNLNLVLFPSSSSSAATSPPPPPPASSSSSVLNSVCTLDKVKFALERAERETNNTKQRRSSLSKRTSSTSPSRSSSSVIDNHEIMVGEEEEKMCTFATGCPNCLIYVLVSRNDPKCPRCCSIVPSPPSALLKKPRIDLNISL